MPNQRFRDVMDATSHVNDEFGVPMKGGKSYLMVKDRVQIFRQEFGDEYGIETHINHDQGFNPGAAVVASAFICDKDKRIVASGWAVEFVGSTKLTDASPVEIAETSAIGRALACFGIQGSEYASFNEIEAHIRKDEFRKDRQTQNGPSPQPNQQERESIADRAMKARQPQWYVPTDHDALWNEPDREIDLITQEIERMDNSNDLGRYWSDLKSVVDVLKGSDTGLSMIAEIKAAFATRHNALGAKR